MLNDMFEKILFGAVLKGDFSIFSEINPQHLSIEGKELYENIQKALNEKGEPRPNGYDYDYINDLIYTYIDYENEVDLKILLEFLNSKRVVEDLGIWQSEIKMLERQFKNNYYQVDKIGGKNESVNEFLSHMRKYFQDLRSSQKETSFSSLEDLGDVLLKSIHEESEGNFYKQVPTGFPSLTEIGLFPRETFGILQAPPGTGKSTFCINVLVGTAKNLAMSGTPEYVLLNSLEDGKEQIMKTIASILVKKGIKEIIDEFQEQGLRSKKVTKEIEKHIILLGKHLYINDKVRTISQINNDTLLYLHPKGYEMCLGITDYLQFITPEGKEQSYELELSRMMETFHRLAKQTGSCQLLCAQPTESTAKKFTGIMGMVCNHAPSAARQKARFYLELINCPILTESKVNPITAEELRSYHGFNPEKAYILVHKFNRGEANQRIELNYFSRERIFSDNKLPKGKTSEIEVEINKDYVRELYYA